MIPCLTTRVNQIRAIIFKWIFQNLGLQAFWQRPRWNECMSEWIWPHIYFICVSGIFCRHWKWHKSFPISKCHLFTHCVRLHVCVCVWLCVFVSWKTVLINSMAGHSKHKAILLWAKKECNTHKAIHFQLFHVFKAKKHNSVLSAAR